MTQPVLYLMVGYPGAGKTTTARIICELAGAEHIWADKERRQLFGPIYRREQSDELYTYLNERAVELLKQGRSVVFDTNFNYRKDRDHLRQLAADCKATTRLIWLTVPQDMAYRRAVTDGEKRLFVDMSHEDFERVAAHLEEPAADEQPVRLDGTEITREYVAEALGL